MKNLKLKNIEKIYNVKARNNIINTAKMFNTRRYPAKDEQPKYVT